jgi:hypothetical protein
MCSQPWCVLPFYSSFPLAVPLPPVASELTSCPAASLPVLFLSLSFLFPLTSSCSFRHRLPLPPSFSLSLPSCRPCRTRAAFWGGLSLDSYPFVKAWHDRIDALPVVQDALKVPVQDLVTRVKSTPGLEEEIMERMRKQREENARKAAAVKEEQAAEGGQ